MSFPALRGSERYAACGDDVSDGVLFTGEKYPKAAGDTGAERPFQGQTPPFPRTPFRDNMGPPHEPSAAKTRFPRKAERLSWGEEPQRNE